MTYAIGTALQVALYQTLKQDAGVTLATEGHVFDALPAGTVPPLYALIGAETAKDASDASGDGARHDLVVTVVCEGAGFQAAKEAATAICDALQDARPALSRGHVVSLRFVKAKAARASDGTRRIDLTFRARVSD